MNITQCPSANQSAALEKLKASYELINQSVGDALSVLLFVESILLIERMTPGQWDSEYTDLPNVLLKGKVKDRSVFKAIKADTELVEPKGLQEKVAAHVAKFKSGRAFIRPSVRDGRIYHYRNLWPPRERKTLSECTLKLPLERKPKS